MTDFFSVFDNSIDDCINVIKKTIFIHNYQTIQGFISEIGMVSGNYINFQVPENLVVVGDLHGDFLTLEKIMEKIDFLSFLKNESNLLIFLGDYIDRGEYSLEVLLSICKLKNSYPNNVFMLRGNHESYAHFPFSSYAFYTELLNKFEKSPVDLYNCFILPLFDSLFLFCEINGFSILTHGGLPVIENPHFFKNYKFQLSNILENKPLLEEVLWNDPRDLPYDKPWGFSNRGLGKYFGIRITNMWLANTGCKFLLRGHEPCMGYKLVHENKILTIFSSKAPYPKFESSFLKVSQNDINEINNQGSSFPRYIHIV
ncbi:MAG: serine/threonine protein phosphatase [Nitrosopumilus sp.]|nr:serine/threonine protein phosphatase [Nitrosopumilus sp.]